MRDRVLRELDARALRPAAVASDALNCALYGTAAYGRNPDGLTSHVRRLGRSDVMAFHEACFVPPRVAIAAVGHLDEEALAARCKASLPAREKDPAAASMNGHPPRGGHFIVDHPQATFVEVRVGRPGVRADAHPRPASRGRAPQPVERGSPDRIGRGVLDDLPNALAARTGSVGALDGHPHLCDTHGCRAHSG